MRKAVELVVGWLKLVSLEKLRLIAIRAVVGNIHPVQLLTHSNMTKIVVSKRKAKTMTDI